jgi:hypothetical protein
MILLVGRKGLEHFHIINHRQKVLLIISLINPIITGKQVSGKNTWAF